MFFSKLFNKNYIKNMSSQIIKENVQASMLLSAVGDSMGYRNGKWEFEKSTKSILDSYEKLGGYKNIEINDRDWRLSDDTIMHIATAIAITRPTNTDNESICKEMATAYIRSMEDMGGRAPGIQCINSVQLMTPGMKSKLYKWDEIPYSATAGGCGGSMRSMCIGLKYSGEEQLDDLIELSIESGRITHNNPVGFLGAMVSALFTSYAIRNIEPKEWGTKLMVEALPKAKEYLEKTSNNTNRSMEDYEKGWNYFLTAWKSYLKTRKIPVDLNEKKKFEDDKIEYPVFPKEWSSDCSVRDKYYSSISFSGWWGSSGHDSTIIAYDALLASGNSWEDMIKYSILHGGDNDSTGAIGGAFFGALYGLNGVPEVNYKSLEYRKVIEGLSKALVKSIQEYQIEQEQKKN
ncbi:hypothetical protein DICPUDRAFT_34975 [Dictyostelium purpureum]|uniref:ADP-ribosylhydrolase ARH1 n=1 Tax=Dictyostelium purpureum TaxID=5786 RepID=F0ZNK2_DICPU|nr:uncharacterized protein DICPUDRAFT_34975 [Dictyostelium purpureum]EGC34471.1 hypothetical protein DICPUDRAFT_34975 [Dictyostelium purpureum]|eukprot:XP_003289006.1 hypothetical protein DICPUDRAFT_34975 [Dictyostelium purpureum]